MIKEINLNLHTKSNIGMQPTTQFHPGRVRQTIEPSLYSGSLLHHFSVPEISSYQKNSYAFIFRIVDIFLSFFAVSFLLLTIPFLWVANRLFDPGPLFYNQKRVGKNGKGFTMYKFRSMVVNAEKDGAQFTTQNDDRITRVGIFLRKTRLDELPQAVNVLKGDMSFIGPRPERPEFVKILAQKDDEYTQRLLVKPGLTGWAQVKYKYTDNIEDALVKLRYDLYFLRNRNIKMDFEIIARTIWIVISKQGT